jgi:hypothetical protein
LKARLVSALETKWDEPLSNFAFTFNVRRYTVDHVAVWEIDESPSMCEEREVPDGGHECVPDLAITQLVFRRLCIGKPYCRLSDHEVAEAMAPHVSPACGGHVMSPRIIAQCRPLNLPLPLRQIVPQGDWFLGIQTETRTRDEDFPIAITSSAHMRAMFYSSRTRLPRAHYPMPPPAPPSLCHFKWYKLVIDEVRGGAQGNNNCSLSGVRFHDALGEIMGISSADNPKVGRCKLTILNPMPGFDDRNKKYDQPLSNFAFNFKLRR